jgi:hypothetical protein
MMLFTAFDFLCVVGTALAATTLNLNSQLQGSLVQGSQEYTFSYSKKTSSKYQFVYVLPDVSTDANRPVVTIDKTNVVDVQADFQCSASASSSESQVKCAYSFQGCVKTTAPELYTITVNPPGGAANANLNFTIGSVNVAAGLSASVKALTKQTTCCGFGGASWHYVKASGAEVINSVSLTLTKGSLSTPLPPLYLLHERICQLILMLMLWFDLVQPPRPSARVLQLSQPSCPPASSSSPTPACAPTSASPACSSLARTSPPTPRPSPSSACTSRRPLALLSHNS